MFEQKKLGVESDEIQHNDNELDKQVSGHPTALYRLRRLGECIVKSSVRRSAIAEP